MPIITTPPLVLGKGNSPLELGDNQVFSAMNIYYGGEY